MKHKYDYCQCVEYCRLDNLPQGIKEKYKTYEPNNMDVLIPRDFLREVFNRYEVPKDKQDLLFHATEAVEKDSILFWFTKFLVQDMCSSRNRCDEDFYTNMTPGCMSEYGSLYSFILLLACVVPSMKLMEKRGIPVEYYGKIPYQPLERQMERLVKYNDANVRDFPWDMNFYTCSIFLLDRFYFIPYRFKEPFTMYRNVKSGKVIALRHAGEEFRRDGQRNGINGVFDQCGKFESIWKEDDCCITANPINPMGFVEKETVTILKNEWETALEYGDTLLAFHIPSGSGYVPERVKNSMALAVEFYGRYFPEFNIKGFWSESWLYDSRLSLVLDNEKSNIVNVQRQFYNYPIFQGDGMLRHELFGDNKAEPASMQLKTSLQKAAAKYMEGGKRFNTSGMIVLKEEIEKVGEMPYITGEDIERFRRIVDSHLA